MEQASCRIGLVMVGFLVGCSPAATADKADRAGSAKLLGEQTVAIKRALITVEQTLAEPGLKPDVARDKRLAEIVEKLEIKPAIYRTFGDLDPNLVGQAVEFYVGVRSVNRMIETHVKAAKLDELGFVAARKALDAAKLEANANALLAGQLRYAILTSGGEDDKAPFGAKLVELGPPACDGKIAKTGSCGEGEAVTGFAYRAQIGAVWTLGELATAGDSIPMKRLIPLLPTSTLDAILTGSEPALAEMLYTKRLRELHHSMKDLIEAANKLEAGLEQSANRR